MGYGSLIVLSMISWLIIIIKLADYTEKDKARNVLKGYRSDNIYPVMKYAEKNSVFYSLGLSDVTHDEIFDITLLLNVLKADIPAKYKTIEQKKAYLIATNYKDLNDKHGYQSSDRTNDGRNYATVPDEVLLEILNNDELLTRFAATYYSKKREDVGCDNCIWHLAYDKNSIAEKIIEKAQELWDVYNEKKGEEK